MDVTRLRDACILLAGHRCYREYPMDWIQRQLEANGFRILAAEKVPIVYSEHSIRRQLNVASRKFKFFKDPALADSMRQSIERLDKRMVDVVKRESSNRIRFGFDYIVAAELVPAAPQEPPAVLVLRCQSTLGVA